MSKVKFQVAMALDGYVAGPNQSIENPIGEGGEQLHDWLFRLKAFNELHGMEGGETGPSDDVVREHFASLGATVMGRNMFGGGPGPWPAEPWDGWWGEDPPFHTPVFVLTHYPREPLAMQGGTTFHFVTDGIESALQKAKAAAGDKDVQIGGGAATLNQYLAAGLVDEFDLHLVPIVLGAGERLFENLGTPPPRIELTRTVPAEGVAHLRYRVLHD